MNVIDAIFTRRSIRKYTGQPIEQGELEQILKAGFYAPSAHNHQPWHFIVVRDPRILEKIAAGHQYSKMLPQAGCAIIVCGDTKKEELLGFLIEDCSAAIQNMLLAAHGLGLGAVWCGLYPVTRLTALIGGLLGLPSKIIPVGMVVVGHGDEARNVPDRYDENRVHLDKW
jgi:nitroreductase